MPPSIFQKRIAACKAHIKSIHNPFPDVADALIVEIEGKKKSPDPAKWNRFIGEQWTDEQMFKRLDGFLRFKRRETARKFLAHAQEFRCASKQLSNAKPFQFHPAFYCAFHSIELALKCNLVLVGMPQSLLATNKLGHNLDALLQKARDCKAVDVSVLDKRDEKAIGYASKDYSTKCFEYPEFFTSTLPIGRWIQIADVLISNAEKQLPQKRKK